jgi:beta-N-acetylhexosaminidase
MTRRVAAAMGDELRAMGFNLDFAPVADVDSNPRNPVIGDRSFGRDPAEVSKHVVAFADGLQSQGIIACVKHFPGHGDTDVDSHKALPVVDKDVRDLENLELIPFKAAVDAGIDMVMTSHVLFPALDEDHPATMSRAVLHGLLRERLGYSGVVISDDLEMKAVRDRWSIRVVLEKASEASVDLFCIGRSFEPDLTLTVSAWEALIRLQEESKRHHTCASTAVRRLRLLREKHLRYTTPPPDLAVVGSTAHQALAADLHRRGSGIA